MMKIFPRRLPIIIDWMIPLFVECVQDQGSEEVPYSKDLSTQTLVECGFGFATQAQNIDCYEDSMGLGGNASR